MPLRVAEGYFSSSTLQAVVSDGELQHQSESGPSVQDPTHTKARVVISHIESYTAGAVRV